MASATSSSASTSNATRRRIDEEDKHSEEGVDEIEASRRLFLLDLPDELLVHVFDQVYQSLRPRDDVPAHGILVPLSQILVNKRIFSLAHPLWFRTLSVPYGHPENDRYFAQLVRHKDVHPHVQSFMMEHSWHLPYSQYTALLFLSNLTSLSTSFDCADGDSDVTEYIPAELTDTLKSLSSLRDWRIESYPSFEDESFSLDRDLPSLRRLDTGSIAVLAGLFNNGATKLLHLILRHVGFDELENVAIPWRTLRAITFEPDMPTGSGKILVDSLTPAVKAADATHTMLQLDQLSLKFDVFRPWAFGSSPSFTRAHLLAMLQHLQLSRLRRLSLSTLTKVDWPSCDVSLGSVQELVLEGTCRLTEPSNLRSLHAFLSMFPSLSTLILRGFVFSSTGSQTAGRLSSLSSIDLTLDYPTLVAFLALLRKTNVREFRFSAANEEQEMRWTRTSRDEDFVGERWALV